MICLICLSPVYLNIDCKDLESGSPKLNSVYMKTPCGHDFHGQCLTKWLNIALKCPTCRESIPLPVDNE